MTHDTIAIALIATGTAALLCIVAWQWLRLRQFATVLQNERAAFQRNLDALTVDNSEYHDALRTIVGKETPRANATVRRMARVARKALERQA